jgi:hypothetical protein
MHGRPEHSRQFAAVKAVAVAADCGIATLCDATVLAA